MPPLPRSAVREFLRGLSLVIAMTGALSCGEADEPAADSRPPEQDPRPPPSTPGMIGGGPLESEERRVFFGDLHVHSSWSFDAYGAGVVARPIHAYQYARGEAIPHLSGEDIRLAGPPLDFMALTDHAEYLGLSQAASQAQHPIHRQPLIQSWLSDDEATSARAWRILLRSYRNREPFPVLVTDAVIKPAWQALVRLANEQNRPGEFTTFVGFEYTANPQGQNLHRNVLFRGGDVPERPFSSMDSGNPEDLWAWMDEQRSGGRDVLSIPHNSNGSNGLMFASERFDGTPIDLEWIARRARNEPLAEAFQIKGQSETHPALSPDDEWADFEVADWRTTAAHLPSKPSGSYLRDALKRGLLLGETRGENPYVLGLVGSTDGHMSSSPFEERNFTGKIGLSDATPEGRLGLSRSPRPSGEPTVSISARWSAAGLAGVWAGANTREEIFDALRRRETFATSGPRIRVRFFGGWDSEPPDGGSRVTGPVPMGGVLIPEESARSETRSPAPVFEIAALQDPLDAGLERAQIVKGWLDDGDVQERVYDVACASGEAPDPIRHRCPNVSPEPELETCATRPDVGTSELRVRWRDPDYDPTEPAFYYARILQVPSCRWSTYDASRLGREPLAGVPATIQERAITSPIWIRSDSRQREIP